MNDSFKYASIDIETLGLDEQNCDVIEIGIVVDDLLRPENQERATFHCYILPGGGSNDDVYCGQPYAMSMHPQILRRIATREEGFQYLKSYEVSGAVDLFLRASGFTDKVTVTGKNYGMFDNRFLRPLPGWENLNIHHRVIDPGNLYFNPLTDKCIPDTKECMRRAGIAGEVAHTSLGDAMTVIQLVRHKLAPGTLKVAAAA